MESKKEVIHTSEPWRYQKYKQKAIIVDCAAADHIIGEVKNEEDARRIVACVNACKGISTKNMEENRPFKEGLHGLNDRIRSADRQRDELLAALKEAAGWLSGWASAEHELSLIRAAIAKCEVKS